MLVPVVSSREPTPLPEPGPRPGTPAGSTPWACVMCDRSAPEPGGCCSTRCASDAQAALEHNARLLRRLRRHGGDAARARRLAERNGHLSSALLRWRPAPTDTVPPAVATADHASTAVPAA